MPVPTAPKYSQAESHTLYTEVLLGLLVQTHPLEFNHLLRAPQQCASWRGRVGIRQRKYDVVAASKTHGGVGGATRFQIAVPRGNKLGSTAFFFLPQSHTLTQLMPYSSYA